MKEKFSAYILTEDQKKILQYIQELSMSTESNFKTQLEISKDIGISRTRVNFHINSLIGRDIIEKITIGHKSSYKIKE